MKLFFLVFIALASAEKDYDYYGSSVDTMATSWWTTGTTEVPSTSSLSYPPPPTYPDPTSPPSPSPSDPTQQCGCEGDSLKRSLPSSWNDVMVLADSSNAMGADRFFELWGYIVSSMGTTTISRNGPTRVGVITYGDQAQLFANLNYFSSTNQFLSQQWPYKGDQYTNILAGVDMAITEFNANGRVNSRKVMIIGASTYRNGNYHLPLNETQTFKLNFGIVIVIAYGDINGQDAAILKGMASDGYYIDATNGAPDFLELQQKICNANCFCPGQMNNDGYFPAGVQYLSPPSEGCFWDSSLKAAQSVASVICSNLHFAPGSLAMPKTSDQQRSIIEHIPNNVTDVKPPFYVDLKRISGNTWYWGDGSHYTGPSIDGSGDCAILKQLSGFNVGFQALGCFDGAYYTCQTTPCTATNYCS